MFTKLSPSLLILAFLILIPLNAKAQVFPCTMQSLAGNFDGVISGTLDGGPFSALMYLTLNSDGTLRIDYLLGVPGETGMTFTGGGDSGWSLIVDTPPFCYAEIQEDFLLLGFFDAGNEMLVSSPYSEIIQTAGVLRRRGF